LPSSFSLPLAGGLNHFSSPGLHGYKPVQGEAIIMQNVRWAQFIEAKFPPSDAVR
jgi:hypothetical protein